jgi:hypothetical protein
MRRELMRRVFDDQAWAAELGRAAKAARSANLSLDVAGANRQPAGRDQALRRHAR